MSEKLDMTLAHHHTALCVSNWEISSAFYERLGFRVENDWYWPDGVKNHKSLLCFCKKPDCWLESVLKPSHCVKNDDVIEWEHEET